MAKFCTRCGKPLIDGQPCECTRPKIHPQGDQDDETVMLKEQQDASADTQSQNHDQEEKRQADPYVNQQQGNPYMNQQQGNPYMNQQQGNPYMGQQQGNPYMGQQQGNPYMGQQQGNPYMNQQQGNPYMGQQQGNPYMGQQQGNPYMGQQQGNPYMNQQQGNPYMGQQQGNPYMNQQQSGPYGNPQGNFNSQWFQEKTGRFVKNTKNMFAEIPPLITRPDTTMKRLCDSNSNVMGLEMVGLKAVVCLLISLFLVSRIRSMMGGFFDFPVFRMIIFILILTVGFAYMQAAIFKGTVTLFKGDTTIHKMMTAVGFGAFVDSVMLLLTALFIMSFPKFAIVLLCILSLISFCFYLRGYEHAVKMQSDRKVYCFIVAQVLTVAAIALVLYIVLPIIFDLPVRDMEDLLESFM
ncbi:MAG: hypothetical protein ACOX8E_07840 [Ruminococcus sp.]|jgi:hypothetical protein